MSYTPKKNIDKRTMFVKNIFHQTSRSFSSGQALKSYASGQAMLILIMILGATMLGVTTIAGYVSLQKIRTATDIVDSTKSIYAADAGVEWWLYKNMRNASTTAQPTFSNNVTLEVQEFPNLVKSIGHAGRSYRAFGVFLDEFSQGN